MYHLSTRSKAILQTVNLKLQIIIKEAILHSPLDFGIPNSGGYRTEEEQNTLFLSGSSKLDGYIKKSRHQTGEAIDIYAYVDGRASWDPKHLTLIAGHILGTAKRLGHELEWGGDWRTFIDMPHFELPRKR